MASPKNTALASPRRTPPRRRWPSTAAQLAMALGCAVVLDAASPRQPNILFIMSDDHAAHAIGAYGSRINETPHMDRLAREGMRFDRCYAVNSICTPSRASILTGQYSHRNGVPVFNALDGSRPNVAKSLQAAGYQTAMIGKWHLGSDPTGFHYWQILPGQGAYFDPILYGTDGEQTYPGHATDVITDLGLRWLDRREPGKPFFLMLHHKAPHRNWQPQPALAQAWARRQVPEPATLFDDYATRADAVREQRQSVARDLTPTDVKQTPPPGLAGDALVRWKYQRYMQDYLACVQGVDESVGKVLAWLDARQLGDSTVVIYSSDQGFFLGDHGLYDKRFMYEESSRMPFLVRWPAGIRPGSSTPALAINCDIAPTFLELAGLPTPADMQGRSLVPLFRGERPADWRTSFYYRYYHDPGHHNTRAHYGVRTDTHKLIHYPTKKQWELFDLVQDPAELRNLYDDPAAQPAVARLKVELDRLRRELGDTEDRFADPATWPKSTADVLAPSRRTAANRRGLRWEQSPSRVALRRADQTVWQFQFDTNISTKPFFHPIALPGGAPLTWQSPPDHVWHYGLWFSWKYINRVNYWEQNREGLCDGVTEWSNVRITTRSNYAATIALDLHYYPRTRPQPVLTEHRTITVSPPAADGSYAMDWTLDFTTGDEAVTLDRTPPAGQPGGQAWGGYAGLSVRFAKELADVRVVATGDTGEQHDHRYGFSATAADLHGRISETDAGIAFLEHPDNPRHPSRWYAIADPGVPFWYLNAAWLQLEPYLVPARGRLTLRYRVMVHPGRWTPERLAAEQRRYAEDARNP